MLLLLLLLLFSPEKGSMTDGGFLVEIDRLYISLCRSASPSVGLSVCHSVGRGTVVRFCYPIVTINIVAPSFVSVLFFPKSTFCLCSTQEFHPK